MDSSDDNEIGYEENDEDSLCKYGTQLPQYEADEIPSKKPMQVEDMVVKDENGRRRFHGAFTGGFSAGYWNTVGSKEGFTPTEFKSSRSEKAAAKSFKPTDFMDEEDFSEFGIAPQKIQTKQDFGTSSSASNSGKRRREAPSDGPIPGEPVLRNFLKPVHDKAAVRILKKMGWRDGQGIGSRMSYSEKKRTLERNKKEMYIQNKYGDNESENDEISDEEITFVPDDFDPFIANIKDNTFGLGYSGLKPSTLKDQHINLFQPFSVYDKKSNKKFSILGQAFGIGALEDDDDDDIYAMDEMSNYDRTLETEKNKTVSKKVSNPLDSTVIEGFSRASINDWTVRAYPVDVPRDYEPRNWLQRKSRFAPIDKDLQKVIEAKNKHKVLGLGRHDLKPQERGALLNEAEVNQKSIETSKKDDEQKKAKSEESSKKMLELLNSKQFVSEHSSKNETFKPFITNPDKQERYEKFLELKTSDESIIEKFFNDVQPLRMSLFDREMEKKEFIQAKRMYQPLDSLIGNRFIKEVDIQKEPEVHKKIKDGKEVIVIQRTKSMWKPNKVLCKLFNIPEPYGGMMFDEEEEKKKKKQSSSLFDYIGVPLNSKTNFVTPQVIPRKLTEDHRKQNEEEERRKSFLEAVEKEKSFMNRRATAKDFFDVQEPSLSKETESDARKKEVKKLQPEPPKTELEIKVAESVHKKPEEKKDLFKAIFCDSDEDEDGPQEHSMESTEAVKNSNSDAIEGSSTLSEKQKSTFIESFLSTKSASEINVLRNASPPRGIFKSIFELGASTSKMSEKETKIIDVDEEIIYGPALPKNIPNANNFSEKNIKSNDESSSSTSDSSLDEKLLKKLKKVKSSSKERWVEKDKVKKSKKHKKKKSHKKSHKKHKSKK